MFARPGVGLVIAEDGGAYVVDYGGTVVRRVFADGRAEVAADGLRSPVALTMAPDGTLLTGTWGDGAIYRIALP